MLQLLIIDTSATERNRLHEYVSQQLSSNIDGLDLIPKISVEVSDLTEAKYKVTPDICLVGRNLSLKNPGELKKVRERWPKAALITKLNQLSDSVGALESLARIGIDDLVTSNTTPTEFLAKILIHSRRQKSEQKGQLIVVESGKGGQGVTSITAALAELLARSDKKVLMVDFDSATQDLSRFLHVRPFFNENLSDLLTAKKSLTKESVSECISAVQDNENLFCLTPARETDYGLSGESLRRFVSIFEYLDESFDYVVVDPGNLMTASRTALYRLVDQLIYLVGNDPASIYASVSSYRQIWPHLSAGVRATILENATRPKGLKSQLIHKELTAQMGLEADNWLPDSLLYSREGTFWPGSGQTLYSLSSSSNKKAFSSLVARLNSQGKSKQESMKSSLVSRVRLTSYMKEINVGSALRYLQSLKPKPVQYPELPMINLYSESSEELKLKPGSDSELLKKDSPELESWLSSQVAS